MKDEQILEQLLKEYPSGEINKITKSSSYPDIQKIANKKGLTVTNYLSDIGFTMTRGSLDEEDVFEELMKLFPDGKVYSLSSHNKIYVSLGNIAKEQKCSLNDLLSDYGLVITRKPRNDVLNGAIPVTLAALEKENYLNVRKYDEFLMKELIDGYNFIGSDFSVYLGVTRQAVAAKMKRVKKSSFSWSVDELPAEHLSFFKKMMVEEVAKDESATHNYCISYNPEEKQFAFSLFPKDFSDFPMCLKDDSIPVDTVTALFEKDYHIFNTRDFLTLQNIRTSPTADYSVTSGCLYVTYRNLVQKHYDYHMNTLDKTDVYYQVENDDNRFVQFAKYKNIDFVKDSRLIPDEDIRAVLESFRNPVSDVVKIPIGDAQYHRLINLAKNRGHTIKSFIESFGFNYKRVRGIDVYYEQKLKQKRLQRLQHYKVTNDAVYISSYTNLYTHLTNQGRAKGFNLTDYLWHEFDLKRIEFKDLPKGYTPYELGDSEEDLDKEELFLKFIETNLMIDAEDSYFYIDSGAQFYGSILKYCTLIGITVDNFFEKWELKRLNYQDSLTYLINKANFTEEEAKEYLNRTHFEFADEGDTNISISETDNQVIADLEEIVTDSSPSQLAQDVFNEFSNILTPELLLLLTEDLSSFEDVDSENEDNGEIEEQKTTDDVLDEREENDDLSSPIDVEYVDAEDVVVGELDEAELLEFLKNLSNQVKGTITTEEKKSRSQVLVKKMKELYGYKCQLCNPELPLPAIEMLNGLEYVEMHHIIPISDSSAEDETDLILDDYRNCVVVCSHHHKVLHYHKGGFKEIDEMIDGLYFVNNDTEVKIYSNKHLEFNES